MNTKNRLLSLAFLFLTLTFLACAKPDGEITYLALGDSYTIGESVAESERWPMQLVDSLNKDGFEITTTKIIAKTGWRTDDLQQAIAEQLTTEKYAVVSLLIGVNNQYQGKSIDVYKDELRVLIKEAIFRCTNGTHGVFVLSIPDYGVTPFANNDKSISKELADWNNACKTVCKEYNIPFYDITPISQRAETDLTLLADDQLHPSGKMYKQWVDLIYKDVKLLFGNE